MSCVLGLAQHFYTSTTAATDPCHANGQSSVIALRPYSESGRGILHYIADSPMTTQTPEHSDLSHSSALMTTRRAVLLITLC